jgi:hypothetical protein
MNLRAIADIKLVITSKYSSAVLRLKLDPIISIKSNKSLIVIL